MISICIPIYNFDIAPLINELSKQALSLEEAYEIILIDDASQLFKEKNRIGAQGHTLIELNENVGRAKIRNLFLEHTSFNYLLFLDCDSLICESDFLQKYIDEIAQQPAVVCGGRIYRNHPPTKERLLRWKYGVQRESQSAESRRSAPNQSFMTNNFLIQKEVLEAIKFDERIANYGHEDTLFGYELKKKGIEITHIANPILNGDLEENAVYLNKTKEGIVNLVKILNFFDYEEGLIKDVKLLKANFQLRPFKKLILFFFHRFHSNIYERLRSGKVNLYLFDFYKLGFFITQMELTSKTK